MDETIFNNIKKLSTPVGFFSVYSGNENISFSVINNEFNIPYEVYNDNENLIGSISTNTNYEIKIETSKLKIGEEYRIQFSNGKFKYCDSDEHTSCYDAVIDGWVVGIGAYDPNDEEKFEQAFCYSKIKGYLEENYIRTLDKYDETSFTKYTTEVCDDLNGFTFRIFDYSREFIFFSVAWVKVEEFQMIDYEEAIGLWLC